jgi:parallel beta-helix repeat protein
MEGMEERTVPATFHVSAGGSIQAALTSAAATSDGNDIINIDPATYIGNLVISNSPNLTNLLIQKTPGSTGNVTIKASSSGAILTVDGETGVTIQSLVFDGSGTPANDGIFVKNGGQSTIQSNIIQNIAPTSGEGIGIRVGRSVFAGGATTGTATISSNVVTGYGDAGIVIANTGSSGTVSSNTVTGLGAPAHTDQNGIEISYGASGSVNSNTVSANGKKNGDFVSVGIFLYKAASGVQINANSLSNNNFGISVMDGTSPTITNNAISGSTYYGIGFDSSDGGVNNFTHGATVTGNSSSNTLSGTVADGFDFWYLHSSTANPVTISNNTANGNTGDGFNFFSSSADTAGTWTMSGTDNANGNGGNGYNIQNSSGLRVDGLDSGTIGNANGNGANGILIQNSQNVTVDDYNANGNLANGVYVTGSTGVSINDTQAAGESLNGFLLENSSGLTITNDLAGSTTGNKASNGLNGFSFVNTTGSSVTGNTAERNGSNGILFDATSSGNTLSGNTLNTNNKSNNGSFDANDQTGTATTVLNFWSGDSIGTKNKSVIS